MPDEPVADALRESRRSPESFAFFYEQYYEAVLKFIARKVYDPEVAVDLSAESFARAFVDRASFRGRTDAEAGGWIFQIARNQLGMFLRRGEVERKAMQRLRLEPPEPGDDELRRVVEMAGLSELRMSVRARLRRLSPDQQEALELRVVRELPYPDIASRLGISQVAARARVARGLRSIRADLEASEGRTDGESDE